MVQGQGPTGATGHTGPDGSTMRTRIERHMKWESTIGENIQYNSQTPLEALLSLVIDDGVPSRGHRNNIFSTRFYYMGAATGMHSRFQSMTVTDFSGAWNPQSFNAPTIHVPLSARSYTDWSAWSDQPSCNRATLGEAADGPFFVAKMENDSLNFLQ